MNPPTQNPLDRAKYREQYLSNLRLQASNDQKNLNANRIYKETGVSPIATLPDTRTTTEKSQDFEGSKVELRSKLGTITDGVIASQIVGELDSSQILFALNNWLIIESDMRRQFGKGVPTSAFISYLNRLISKFQLTEGVETGLQQATGEAILMSNIQILQGLPQAKIMSLLRDTLDKVYRQFHLNIDRPLTLMREMENLIPNEQTIQSMEHLNDAEKAEVMQLMNEALRFFPTNDTISTAIQRLSFGMANRDPRFTASILDDLVQTLTLSPAVQHLAEEIREFIRVPDVPAAAAAPQTPIREGQNNDNTPFHTPLERGTPKQPRTPEKVAEIWDSKTVAQKLQILKSLKDGGYEIEIPNKKDSSFRKQELDNIWNKYKSDNNMEGHGLSVKMTGKGLLKNRKKNTKSITHLIDKNFEKPKPYTQLGRYFINKRRLINDNVIMFRQPSGNTISVLPTEKVSPALADILTALTENKIPSYESINRLSDDDKDKLAHVCQVCRVESPSVPKNKVKSANQQEEDRFNILRGEIIAGNDSPKIAKDLKILLLKFMNEGRIPKRQANEILQELLVLGH
jgi:hypothetical protein